MAAPRASFFEQLTNVNRGGVFMGPLGLPTQIPLGTSNRAFHSRPQAPLTIEKLVEIEKSEAASGVPLTVPLINDYGVQNFLATWLQTQDPRKPEPPPPPPPELQPCPTGYARLANGDCFQLTTTPDPTTTMYNPLQQTHGPGSVPVGFRFDTGGLIPLAGAAGGIACDRISDPRWKALCMAGLGVVTSQLGNRSSSSTLASCPTGFEPAPQGGCRRKGISQVLPGDFGLPDSGWTPAAGQYGAGYVPLAVERVQRVCPKRHVLGDDGVCYKRGQVSRSNRAHNPGAKPMFTGGDMNALRRVKQLKKKGREVFRLSGNATKPPCGCKSGRKK